MTVEGGCRRAYGESPGLGNDFEGLEDEGTWPET